ncbi:hypothetical protein J3Q64DRAFT_1702559 [Phycomyces blakesleeanus]|uniref:Uncharacterized protein n=1 Tax=Phycomyces blakesleeanus TaxID=4837 RepID=A0ABR3AMV2_PHYBL
MADEKKLTLFSGHPSLKVLWILLSRRNALKEITRNINTLWSRYQPIDSKPNTLNQSNSFREHVLISINSNQPLILGKKIQKIQTHKTTVSNFVNTVEARIKDSPFCTVKRSVQIDAQTFWRLAKESGIEDYPKSSKNEEMLSDFYYKLFDFSKIGFRARESISIGRKIFKNAVYSDGYSISFLFSRVSKKSNYNATQKKVVRFLNEIEDRCQVWVLDHGITAVLQCKESVFNVIWN